jgi:hypothetical protein
LGIAVVLVRIRWLPVDSPPLVISSETTYLTGPLNPDGTVDYVGALNAAAEEGITPENNAAVPILKALGPKALDRDIQTCGKIFTDLGMQPLPDFGDYFLDWEGYMKRKVPAGMDFPLDKLRGEFDHLREAKWSAADHPIWAEWLKRNERPLVLLTAASQRSRYFVPLVCPPDSHLLSESRDDHLRILAAAARAVACRGMMRVGAGNIDQAWHDAMTLRRLGRLLSQGFGSLSYLGGLQLDAFGSALTIAIVESGRLNTSQVHSMLQQTSELPDLAGWEQGIDRGDRLEALDVLAHIDDKHLDPNLMLRYANSMFDRLIAANEVAGYKERNAALHEVPDGVEEQILRDAKQIRTVGGKLAFLLLHSRRESQQAMSLMIANVPLIPFLTWASQFDATRSAAVSRRDLAHVAIALAAFRAAEGKYPESLRQLSQKDLAKLPTDPFTGQPLHYETKGGGFVLYSAGLQGNRKNPQDIVRVE